MWSLVAQAGGGMTSGGPHAPDRVGGGAGSEAVLDISGPSCPSKQRLDAGASRRIVHGQRPLGDRQGIAPMALVRTLPSFAVGRRAFDVRTDPTGRSGEPDRPIRSHGEIIRRIQPPAVDAVGRDLNRRQVFGVRAANDTPAAMLARDDPACAVQPVAIGEIAAFQCHKGTRPHPPERCCGATKEGGHQARSGETIHS